MDTSEQYIKMRLAAIPDMGGGDTTLTGRITQMFGNDAVMDEYGNYYTGYRSMCFKLERQDQLQEMALKVGEPLEALLTRFRDEYSLIDDDGTFAVWLKGFTSMEQLWLAFVMKEKYDKTWNENQWR